MPDRPMFTFTTSISAPTRRVRCHECGWTARGNTEATFKKADQHVCPPSRDSDRSEENR